MAILNREDFFNRIHDRFGDDTSDEGIAFLEDMSDTYNDLENRASGDGTDWKAEYDKLNQSWKERYRHRFFSGSGRGNAADVGGEDEDDGYNPESVTIEDLFE